MSPKRVLIVSPHGLFREGLRHLLADVTSLVIIGQITSLQEAEALARTQKVDAVIIEQVDNVNDETGRAISRLLSLPGMCVITVSLNTDEMRVYRQEQMIKMTAADLVIALTE
jgi:DNA-binding NarL/FixJ family response regulator